MKLIIPIIAIVILACAACSRGSVPPIAVIPPEVGLFAGIESVGQTLVHWGLWTVASGLVAVIAGFFFFGFSTGILNTCVTVIEVAAVTAIVGAIFVWLASHAVLVVLALILTAVAWAYWRRDTLQSWLVSWKSLIAKAKGLI